MTYIFFALLFVLALFAVAVFLLRKLNLYSRKILGNKSSFKINDIAYLDSGTKIYSVQHVDTEYIILLSKNGNMLIDKRSVHVIDA